MPITIHKIAERRAKVTFTFYGDEVNVYYRPDKVTKEFRAESLRLRREMLQRGKRAEELQQRIQDVAAEDAAELAVKDADAETAINEMQALDGELKKRLDMMLHIVVDEWDVLQDDGKQLLPTLENLAGIPPEFESEVISAIIMDATQGEVKGQRNTNS